MTGFESWWKTYITGTGNDPCDEAGCRAAYAAGVLAGAADRQRQDAALVKSDQQRQRNALEAKRRQRHVTTDVLEYHNGAAIELAKTYEAICQAPLTTPTTGRT